MRVFSFIAKISSTEYAIFEDGAQVASDTIEHAQSDLHALLTPPEQGLFRYNALMAHLAESGIMLSHTDIVVTQTGFEELPPGIYLVDKDLLAFLEPGKIDENHLRAAAYVAHKLAEHVNRQYEAECMPFIVEPATDDELLPEAKISGVKGVMRSPFFHAFSQRAAAYLYANKVGKDPTEIRIAVAHLGTEISVGAYELGRIIDSNSPLDGEGPLSPTTSGSLPVDTLVRLCYSGKYDMDEIMRLINQEGGLKAYLSSSKLADVRKSWHGGDATTRRMVAAMAYQVAREIGARVSAINSRTGLTEAIVLTGTWAVFEEFTDQIRERVEWIAPVEIHVWKSELFMLAVAAIETFKGNHKILLYRR